MIRKSRRHVCLGSTRIVAFSADSNIEQHNKVLSAFHDDIVEYSKWKHYYHLVDKTNIAEVIHNDLLVTNTG